MKKVLSLLLTLALIISTMVTGFVVKTSAIPASGNLIVNGDFETDTGFSQDSVTNRFPGPMYASPAWTTAAQFHKWFRATTGNATILSKIITDPSNSGNKIASAMQTAVQGVTVIPGKSYHLTFSAKADFTFQKFNVSFADVTNAGTNSSYPNLYPVKSVTGTKSYLNNGTTVTESCSPLYAVNYPAGNRIQMAMTTDKWVTYDLYVTINDAYNSTQRATPHLCALRFTADDYSGTVGNAANVPFYLDNVSLYETFPVTAAAEDISGQNGGYLETPAITNAYAGQSVTIKAVPFTGNSFAGWYLNGSLVSSGAEYTFIASDTANYIAKFTGSTLKYVPNSAPITTDDIIAADSNLMISYPHYGTPVFTEPSGQFNAEVRAPSTYGTTGWSAWVENEYTRWDCTVGTVTYGAKNVYLNMYAGYSIPVTLPAGVSPELLTLVIKHGNDLTLRSPMSVSVVANLNSNYYMMDLTDTHMGWNFDDTQDGKESPTAFGLMCQALKVTGIRFLSHTGDTSLYPLASKADNLKNMLMGKQLQYSGSTLPFVMTAGNHEYDTYVYPQASITTQTTFDADGDGIPEFDGLGRFNNNTFDTYFGMQDALMPMGSSMLVAKHDFYAYWGMPALISAMATKWNAVAPSYSYRLLFEHTHNDANQSLFTSPNSPPTPTPYPTLEMKGHDHAWTINQTSPYRVLSVGGGAWEGGSGALVNFNYSGGSWSSPADSGTWTKATTQSKLINDARYNSPSVKIRDTYVNKNDGTAVSNSCTITNEVNFNFYDGRIRFVMKKGSYNIANGTVLSQYDSADDTKTIVLAKVNIPASGSVSVAISSGTVVNSTATFDSQGGSTVAPQTVQAGTAISAPADPTKQGYTFNGWYTAAAGGTKVSFPYTVVSNVTLYAQWSIIPTSYTVTFDSGNGSAVAPQTVAPGTAIAAPAEPIKAGYTFVGWYTAASGGTKITYPYTVTATITLFAHWYSTASNLLTNGDFETSTGFAQDSITNRFNSPLYANPAWTTVDKYHQWFRASVGNASIYSNIITDPSNPNNQIARVMQTALQGVTIESNKTYNLSFSAKADYAFKQFDISFMDMTNAATNSIYPTLFPITAVTGTKTYNNGGTQVVESITPYYAAGASIQMPLETDKWVTYNLTLTVGNGDATKLCALKFFCVDYTSTAGQPACAPYYLDNVSLAEVIDQPLENYTIAFNSEGGTAVASQTVTAGTSVAVPNDPTKVGYTFTGWYTAAAGGTKITFPYSVTANITLHAQWTSVPHTVTYNSEGGSAVTSQTVPYHTAIIAPADPNKTGFVFAGWFTDATGGTKITFPYIVDDDITLHARWTAVTYTVTFDSEGGTVVDSIAVGSNTIITAPIDPTKTGFVFTGWFTQATGGTKVTFPYTVTGNVTLYAGWTIPTTHKPGDINNDGDVDLKDITTLSRFVAGWPNLNYNSDALDTNGDDVIDLFDVTLLSRYIAYWAVTIH